MPIVKAADAPHFETYGAEVIGLAAPSRGASQTGVWRVLLKPGSASPLHHLSHEEVFVAIRGRAIVTISGEESELDAGDALIVPPGTPFVLANAADETFEAVVSLPAGALGTVGAETFVPPWAQ
jgi:mannose-6-phosphate isomerase-like protein (cupin superfamily)